MGGGGGGGVCVRVVVVVGSKTVSLWMKMILKGCTEYGNHYEQTAFTALLYATDDFSSTPGQCAVFWNDFPGSRARAGM